jgi:hypothetical protein
MFEKRVLRRIFLPKKEDLIGEWRKLHNEELLNLYPSQIIVKLSESKNMICTGHVASVGK